MAGLWKKIAVVLFLLSVFAIPMSSADAAAIKWQPNWRAATISAAREQKPILVMVSASWCGPCRRMLEQSFTDPRVVARVNSKFVPVIIDADDDSALLERWEVDATPTVLILDPQRRILSRQAGFQTAAQLDARLAAIRGQSPQHLALSSRPPITPAALLRLRETTTVLSTDR